MVIIVVPSMERFNPLGFRGVGPFFEDGAVNPFDFAVGLRTARSGPLLLRTMRGGSSESEQLDPGLVIRALN